MRRGPITSTPSAAVWARSGSILSSTRTVKSAAIPLALIESRDEISRGVPSCKQFLHPRPNCVAHRSERFQDFFALPLSQGGIGQGPMEVLRLLWQGRAAFRGLAA